jgi:hypothetical protein
VSYLTPGSAPPLSADLVLTVAASLGLRLPPEDVDQLRISLSDQVAAIKLLDEAPVDAFNPAIEFDPRWRD